jgi:hypothetical protein
MKTLKLYLAFALIFISYHTSWAQNSLIVNNAEVVVQTADLTGYTGLDPDDFFSMDSTQIDSLYMTRDADVTVFVEASSVSSLSNIHIRLGRTMGNFDIANIALSASGNNLPTGITMTQDGDKFYVALGSYFNVSCYFLEVQLEDLQGNLTSIYSYSNP